MGINDLLHKSKDKRKAISAIRDPISNMVTNKPSRIASILNHHFAAVGKNLASKLPCSQYQHSD